MKKIEMIKEFKRSNSEAVQVNKNIDINLIEKPANSMAKTRSPIIELQNMEHIPD